MSLSRGHSAHRGQPFAPVRVTSARQTPFVGCLAGRSSIGAAGGVCATRDVGVPSDTRRQRPPPVPADLASGARAGAVQVPETVGAIPGPTPGHKNPRESFPIDARGLSLRQEGIRMTTLRAMRPASQPAPGGPRSVRRAFRRSTPGPCAASAGGRPTPAGP